MPGPKCHPKLKVKARGLCSSCYNKVLKVQSALLPKKKAEESDYQLIMGELKKFGKHLHKLFENDDELFKKIGSAK
jgi:hypothetical protein